MAFHIRNPGSMGNENGLNWYDDAIQDSGWLLYPPDWVPLPASQTGGNPGGAGKTGDTPEYLIASNANGSGGGSGSAGAGGSGSGATSAVTTIGTAGSGLVINISWDASVATAPAAFQTAITAAATYLDSLFTNAVTVNISVGWGEVYGYSLGSNALGSSISYLTSVSYATLVNAYKANATSAAQVSAATALAATSPISGANYWLTTADAKALGLYSSTATDGYVGFSSSLPFTYDNSAGVTAGTWDLNAVALHEMTEVMGRQLLSGGTIGTTASSYDLLDLFHYSSAGTLATTAMGGYVSSNGGVTNQGAFNAVSGGDAGDWASSMGNDSFDAFSNSGVVNGFSSADSNIMNLIGWNLAGQVSAKAPTGISLAPATGGLAANLSSGGVAAGTKIGTIAETGGTATDSYSYTLGGTDAGRFTLTPSGNSAVLAAGGSALTGSSAGALYALTLTANDTTNGTATPATPLDVVVDTTANATITLASLLGPANTATPSFIYALGSGQTVNAGGTSGKTVVVAGAGGQKIAAGTGFMDVIFSATSNSTASAMDVISGFTASDMLDFSSISTALRLAGSIRSGSSLAASSIGYQISGGNTFVYVNTSSRSESLTATNMKIEILGSHSLNSSNTIV